MRKLLTVLDYLIAAGSYDQSPTEDILIFFAPELSDIETIHQRSRPARTFRCVFFGYKLAVHESHRIWCVGFFSRTLDVSMQQVRNRARLGLKAMSEYSTQRGTVPWLTNCNLLDGELGVGRSAVELPMSLKAAYGLSTGITLSNTEPSEISMSNEHPKEAFGFMVRLTLDGPRRLMTSLLDHS